MSKTWTSSQTNVINIFNMFSAGDEELGGRKWQQLGTDVLCAPGVYERFAYYLSHVYEIGDGQ
eukprot:1592940-Prymnesium_polylepis.1